MGKAAYGWMVMRDESIPGTVVRTSTIPEELGRLVYLLTDKTGTARAHACAPTGAAVCTCVCAVCARLPGFVGNACVCMDGLLCVGPHRVMTVCVCVCV